MIPRRSNSAHLFVICCAIILLWKPVYADGPVLPANPQVQAGTGSISASNGQMVVNQSSRRAIIDWQDFSVGRSAGVTFNMPDSGSAVLNRVTGTTTSTIAGTITGNGQVYLINPNGIAITATGMVKMSGGFVGSALDIGNDDFMAGRLRFTGNSAGVVSNEGSITAGKGGFVGLLSNSGIDNSGQISVPAGKVALGTGSAITLDPSGDGFMQILVPSTFQDGAAINLGGKIKAKGGRVEIKASSAGQLVRNLVNIPGEVDVSSVRREGGTIVLGGGQSGVVVSGRLKASSAKANGGKINIGGKNIALRGAIVDVSGASGGTVTVGGSWHGAAIPGMTTADAVSIDESSSITASGSTGKGGDVTVWSNNSTTFRGTIASTGIGGDGGNAEVSSHGTFIYDGTVDLSSIDGKTGDLLLDPYNVTISSSANANQSGFTATGNNAVINTTTLKNALATANVTVSTGTSGTQSGDITVASSLTWSGGHTLTLAAARDILVNANITSNGGTITLNAGRAVSVTNATVNTGGGNLSATGVTSDTTTGITLNGATLNVGSGTGTLSGTSTSGKGVWFTSSSNTLSASGVGSITITGQSSSSYGVAINTDLTNAGHIAVSGSSSSSNGLWLLGTTIASSGDLALSGTSVSSNATWLNGNTLTLSNTGSGTYTLNGSGAQNGIRLNTSSNITTAGAVQISGTSSSGGSGFSLKGSNLITVGSGSTTITGEASGTYVGIDLSSSSNSVTNSGTGTLTLNGVNGIALAATVTSPSGGLVIDATGDLTLASGAQISGASPVLAATGAFINNAGSNAVTASTGRWLIYSRTPSGDSFGSLNSANTAVWNASYDQQSPTSVSVLGNRYVFSTQPTLTITSTSTSKIYGIDATTAVAASFSISGYDSGVSGIYLADNASTAVSGTPAVTSPGSGTTADVGSYVINVAQGSLSAVSGYALSYASTAQLTIGKAMLTLTGNTTATTYNGAAQTNTGASYAGAQGADSFTITGYASGSNIGTYTDALAVTANNATLLSNYTVNVASQGQLTIGKANLTITGNATATTYNGAAQTNTFATSGLVGSDGVTTVAGLASGTNAGSYADTLSGAAGTGLSNYTISYVNGGLTIGKAMLTLTGNTTATTYNGAAQTNTGASYAGAQGADSFTITGYASGSNIGTYTDALAVTANNATLLSNYTVNVASQGQLTIGKANLTITGNATATTYNGAAQTNTFATSGLVGSDGVTTVAGLASGTNAGSYADTLSGAAGTGLSNYTISYVNGGLTIGKAMLTLTGNTTATTYNGAAQTNTGASYAGAQGADSFTITGYASGSNIGTYTDALAVTANNATLLSNYTVNVASQGQLTITGNTPVRGLAPGINAGSYIDAFETRCSTKTTPTSTTAPPLAKRC